jgi:hypothetical protein
MSVASDTKLLEEEIGCEMRAILRPKRPPRPQSEAFLDRVADGSKGSGNNKRKSKRYSAFGVSFRLLNIYPGTFLSFIPIPINFYYMEGKQTQHTYT